LATNRPIWSPWFQQSNEEKFGLFKEPKEFLINNVKDQTIIDCDKIPQGIKFKKVGKKMPF
jgi:hypothetical protein